MEKITYEVQELVGILEKRWKPISYDFDVLAPAIKLEELLLADNPDSDFRIVKKTLVVDVVKD